MKKVDYSKVTLIKTVYADKIRQKDSRLNYEEKINKILSEMANSHILVDIKSTGISTGQTDRIFTQLFFQSK